MKAEELFLKKYRNKISAMDSWVIRFAEEYASLKTKALERKHLIQKHRMKTKKSF